ncbi:MAG: PPC domain-containing protein [Myxococcales bacterium]
MNRVNQLLAALAFAALANQGCNSAASPTYTAITARPLSLKFETEPGSGLAGEALAVKVSLRDGGLPVSGNVTVALADDSSGATLAGTTTRTAVNGVATFDDLVIVKAGEGYTLSASATGAAAVTTTPFTLAYSVDENEVVVGSNDSAQKAVAITPGIPLFGNLSSGDDVDYYKFTAQAGQILTVASYATRLDLANWDTALHLTLFAADQSELTAIGADEIGLDFQTVDYGFTAVQIPQTGTYYLRCEVDGADPSARTGKYALVVKLAASASGLQIEAEAATAVGQNDTKATAQPLSPGVVFGHYQTPGATSTSDSDFYKLTIAGKTRVHLDLTGARNGASGAAAWDPIMELQDSQGTTLWRNDDMVFHDAAIDYVITEPGDYYVRVTRFNANDDGSAPYFLSYDATPYAPVSPAGANTTAQSAMPIAYGEAVQGVFGANATDQYFAFSGEAGDLVRLWFDDATHLQGSALNASNGAVTAQAVFVAADGTSVLRSSLPSQLNAPPANSLYNVLQTILPATGTYFVVVSSNGAGAFGLRLDRVAAAGSGPGWFAGTIANAGDKNTHLVHAEEGQLVTVSLYAGPGASGNDAGPFGNWGSELLPTIAVLDPQGKAVSTISTEAIRTNFAESVLRPEAMVESSFRAAAAGDYAVVVSDAGALSGATPTLFYALQVWRNQ